MRPKAYLQFDASPDDDFTYALAYKLKKFAWEVDELPALEVLRWRVWLGRLRQLEELEAKKGR